MRNISIVCWMNAKVSSVKRRSEAVCGVSRRRPAKARRLAEAELAEFVACGAREVAHLLEGGGQAALGPRHEAHVAEPVVLAGRLLRRRHEQAAVRVAQRDRRAHARELAHLCRPPHQYAAAARAARAPRRVRCTRTHVIRFVL